VTLAQTQKLSVRSRRNKIPLLSRTSACSSFWRSPPFQWVSAHGVATKFECVLTLRQSDQIVLSWRVDRARPINRPVPGQIGLNQPTLRLSDRPQADFKFVNHLAFLLACVAQHVRELAQR
jgi:hypothetical protein